MASAGMSSYFLETFLGGMETLFQDLGPGHVFRTLKPSLVEWKHSPPSAERISGSALKPSLVEWKLCCDRPRESLQNLETFLSGMETAGASGRLLRYNPLKPPRRISNVEVIPGLVNYFQFCRESS